MKRTKAGALAQEIAALFRQHEEVVLGAGDIQEYLSDGRTVDSISAMRVVREIAEKKNWSVFVYDHGAMVRFKRNGAATVNGIPVRNGA